MEQFKNSNECLNKEEPDCEANPANPKCRYASKCDLGHTFENVEECKDPEVKDPCRKNAALCLTACDVATGEESLRCLIERCDIDPTGENCFKCDKCKIERDCTAENLFTDPRCCPDIMCSPECEADPTKCNPPPPEEKCVWGHKVGETISEIFYEPVQSHSIDEEGLASFYNCLKTHLGSES